MGETAQEIAGESIFSRDERREIVRSFVSAYLRGSVKITVWTGNPMWITTGKPMDKAAVVEMKQHFANLVKIASGSSKSTNMSFDTAIDALFGLILSFRSGAFLEGEFLQTPGVEAKLAALEVRVTDIEKLFEELMQRLKVQGQGSAS